MFGVPLIAIIHAADQMGLDQAKLLAGISLDIKSLSLPEKRFSVKQYFRLHQAVADKTGNEDIGLLVGRIIALKGMNLQLYVPRFSNHLRDYLNLIPSLLKLLGDVGQISAYRHDDLVELR